MPFTISHVAAVLPLIRGPVTRLPFVPGALVIGSMIPDVPLLVSTWPSYAFTHSVPGILTIDAAATCAAVVLFHLMLRAPLLELLPRRLDRIPAALPIDRPVRLVLVPVAGAVGAATHAFWDSFTHARSMSTWGWHWLSASPVLGLSAYTLLQYASTVGGLIVICWWSARRLRALPPSTARRPALTPAIRAAVLGALGLATVGCAAIWPTYLYQPRSIGSGVFWTGMGALTGLVCVLLAYCAAFQLRRSLPR